MENKDDLQHRVETIAEGLKESRRLRGAGWKIAVLAGLMCAILGAVIIFGYALWDPFGLFKEQQQAEEQAQADVASIKRIVKGQSQENRKLLVEIECLIREHEDPQLNLDECVARSRGGDPQSEPRSSPR